MRAPQSLKCHWNVNDYARSWLVFDEHAMQSEAEHPQGAVVKATGSHPLHERTVQPQRIQLQVKVPVGGAYKAGQPDETPYVW